MADRDRETVVVTDGGGGGGGGMLIAIIIALVVIIGVIYFVNANSGGQGGSVTVDVPAVDVTQ